MTQEKLDNELKAAASQGNLETAQKYIDAGARGDALGENGRSSLHYAAWNGNVPMAKLLVASGVDVDVRDSDRQTPLHLAVWCNRPAMVGFLLGIGANPEMKGIGDRTPLDLAREHKDDAAALFMEEWMRPENVERRRSAAAAASVRALRARQRKLGSLRPRGPAL